MNKSEINTCLEYINKALTAESCASSLDEFKAWLLSGTKETVKRAAKKKTFDVFACCYEDIKRSFICGVYHDNGKLVATNGNLMAVIRADYDHEKEGKIINRNGSKMAGTFPSYERVIPTKDQLSEPVDIDIINIVKSGQEIVKAFKKMAGKSSPACVKIGNDYIAYEYAKILADFAAAFEGVKICTNVKEGRALVAYTGSYEAQEAMLVIMPMSNDVLWCEYGGIYLPKCRKGFEESDMQDLKKEFFKADFYEREKNGTLTEKDKKQIVFFELAKDIALKVWR